MKKRRFSPGYLVTMMETSSQVGVLNGGWMRSSALAAAFITVSERNLLILQLRLAPLDHLYTISPASNYSSILSINVDKRERIRTVHKKSNAHYVVHGDTRATLVTGTTSRTSGPAPADSRQ